MLLSENVFYPLKRGSDLYYSLLFLTDEKRHATHRLYDFCNNLQDIIHKSKEKDMTLVKLRWWEEEITRLYKGNPEHPLSKALFPAIKDFNLPKPLLEEYHQGITLKLDMDHLCTEEDQILFCYREMGLPQMLNQYIFGFSEHQHLQATHHFSVTVALVNMLVNLKYYSHLGKMPIPLEDFEKANLSMEELLTNNALEPEKTLPLFTLQAKRARHYYEKGLKLLIPSKAYEQHPTLLQARLALRLLDILEEEKFPILAKQISLTPLRKLLFVWKEHRKLVPRKHSKEKRNP